LDEVSQGGAGERFVIESLSYRRAMQASHPSVIKNGYFLNTTTIDAIENLLCDWIELGKSGLAFTGRTRAGKTFATRELVRRLQVAFPRVCIFRLSMETESRNDRHERTYAQCLRQLHSGIADKLRSRSCDGFANYLMSKCKDHGAVQCVLILDEAQKLHYPQWQAMGVIWNRLDDNGIGMCVYSFGNEELRERANILEEGGKEGVVGRYFVRTLDFDGVRSKQELANILAQYDDRLWYPTPEWPFTRYFARVAHDRDHWRLAGEADAFWSALCQHSGVGEKKLHRGYAMQWITDPIHFVLKDCLTRTDWGPDDPPLWSLAIEMTCPPEIC
jgi:hypothetical protein